MKKITKKREYGPQYIYDPGYQNGGEPNKRSPLPKQNYSGFDPLSYRDIPFLDTAFDIQELLKSRNPAETYASLFGIVAPGLASSRVKDVINRPEFKPAFDVLNLSQHQREKLTQKYGLGYLKKWEKEGYPNVFADGGEPSTARPPLPVDIAALDWSKSYVQSPKYQQRLSGFYQYPEYVQRQRASNLENIKMYQHSGRSTQYYPNTNEIGISPGMVEGESLLHPQAKPADIRSEIVAHELGHASTANPYGRGTALSHGEEQYILNRNKNITPERRKEVLQQSKDTSKVPSDFLSGREHDTAPTESKADIDAVRYLMNKEGLYDARKQDLSKDIFNKAKSNKVIKNSATFKRLQENFSDDDLIDIMNKVAVNKPVSNIPIAQDGKKVKGRLSKYISAPQDIQKFNYMDLNPATDRQAVDWVKSYIESPKYRERLSNFYSNPSDISQQRSASIDNVQVLNNKNTKEQGPAAYNPVSKSVVVDEGQMKNYPYMNRAATLVHELSHDSNFNPLNNNSVLSPKEEEYMFSRDKLFGKSLKQLGDRYKDEAKKKGETLSSHIGYNIGLHDYAPAELKSDIDALRFELNRRGIYDARTQDMNPEILRKAKNDIGIHNSFFLNRLQNHYTDSDLIDIMNKVAVNKQNNIPMARNGKSMDYPYGYPAYMYSPNVSMFAEGGGLSREEDYGSKKKPYPSVKSSDFAGGHRSYPIPTKADAVDALRLAGLHGREDVKAKVYKKYPELKKANGGDLSKIRNLTGYNFTPEQTYMNYDNQMFEHGGYVERFNEGSAFCDPTPMYTHDYSNGENGRGGIPPKVYAHGGDMGIYRQGSMFRDPLPTYTHGYLNSNNIPPKVYNFGGTAPTVKPNKAFAASPFPYGTASNYHSFYRDNSYMDTFANGGTMDYSDNEVNPIEYLSEDYPLAKSGIHINPKNKGKFNALKKRTGKTTEELTHSKNPLTRKRAIFAQNARKWKHEDGGDIYAANGVGVDNPFRRYSTEDNPIYYEGNDNLQTQLPLNSPLQTGSQNSFNTTNSDRGFGFNTTLGTFGPIMAASALSSNLTGRQNAAKQSAIDQRRNIQLGPYYNPYGYGDGYGILANGGRMNKVGMTLSEAMDVIRQHGYDIEVND